MDLYAGVDAQILLRKKNPSTHIYARIRKEISGEGAYESIWEVFKSINIEVVYFLPRPLTGDI